MKLNNLTITSTLQIKSVYTAIEHCEHIFKLYVCQTSKSNKVDSRQILFNSELKIAMFL